MLITTIDGFIQAGSVSHCGPSIPNNSLPPNTASQVAAEPGMSGSYPITDGLPPLATYIFCAAADRSGLPATLDRHGEVARRRRPLPHVDGGLLAGTDVLDLAP